MSEHDNLETKAGATGVGAAFEDFMRAFEAFKETNDERLYSLERRSAADPLIEDKLTRIDRALDEHRRVVDDLALKAARPQIGGSAPRSGAALAHKSAFDAYVRKGEPGSLRDLERKALSVGSDPDGGYLVPDETEKTVNRALKDISPIRAIAEGRFGAVAVLSRGSDPAAGHVGFLLGETVSHVVLLGGNQGDAVGVAAFPKTRLLGFRWPQAQPAPQPVPALPVAPDDTLFAAALEHVLKMEGGFSDDPHDPGGPTNRGITLKVFAAWKGVRLDQGSSASLQGELRRIAPDTVRDIYFARYWTPAHCAELSPALAFFHFDAAVNHGVTGAMRLLQRAVGSDPDGEIGPDTRAAIAAHSVGDTLQRYAEARRARYRALHHFWRFGRGWLARVDTTLARATAIAAGTTQTPPDEQKGPPTMTETTQDTQQSAKWWGQSITIWGAIITGLSTVLPALGPAFGIDVTGDLVREAGEGIVQTVQAVGGLVGTIMTIYGRVRATKPLEQRSMQLKL